MTKKLSDYRQIHTLGHADAGSRVAQVMNANLRSCPLSDTAPQLPEVVQGPPLVPTDDDEGVVRSNVRHRVILLLGEHRREDGRRVHMTRKSP